MLDWWTEQWSIGQGPSRSYCGIAQTDEGYAVDIFRGDTCVDSFPYAKRREAVATARMLKLQYMGADRFAQAAAVR